MKIAYLILAHHQPFHLARLIKTLDCDEAYFFIHVDSKVDVSPFKVLVSKTSKTIFLENVDRVKVHWCGYSIVAATLNLLRTAVATGMHFTRYCLLSGSDFPLKKNSEIKEVFSSNIEFLRIDRKLDWISNDLHAGYIKYFHLYDNRFFNPRMTSHKRLLPKIEKFLKVIPRTPYQKIPLYHSSQWWALSDTA
ncbi:beta-1,6-N-acetylglucosaminyltransferase [Thermocoleostomius sinensis]|uniref:beta-1,6-N-acetylglucosaminyltransferase n=1 Tax=Thermocoleostomius sinensis TaxID=3065396 RepID=UPI0036F29186